MIQLGKAFRVVAPKTRARRWIYGASLAFIYIILLAFGYWAALVCFIALVVTRAFDIEREIAELPLPLPTEEVSPLLFEGDGEPPIKRAPRHPESEL